MSGPTEAVRKWCDKNGRNSWNPTGFLFFISKNLFLTGKSTAAKNLRLPPALFVVFFLGFDILHSYCFLFFLNQWNFKGFKRKNEKTFFELVLWSFIIYNCTVSVLVCFWIFTHSNTTSIAIIKYFFCFFRDVKRLFRERLDWMEKEN